MQGLGSGCLNWLILRWNLGLIRMFFSTVRSGFFLESRIRIRVNFTQHEWRRDFQGRIFDESFLGKTKSLPENMVLLLNGDLEVGAQDWSKIGNLICLMLLFRSKAVTNLTFLRRLVSFIRVQHVLSYHLLERLWFPQYSICDLAFADMFLETMVLILDGNSKHVTRACSKIVLFGEKIWFMTDLDLIKCMKQYVRTPLFLSYHLMWVPCLKPGVHTLEHEPQRNQNKLSKRSCKKSIFLSGPAMPFPPPPPLSDRATKKRTF